jgi:hypothetical protein
MGGVADVEQCSEGLHRAQGLIGQLLLLAQLGTLQALLSAFVTP